MISAFYAGVLALIYVALTAYVAAGRFKYRVALGNGGVEALDRRIRMHGNFAEFVPFCLLLVFMVDYAQYSGVIVHVLGLLLVIGRLLHAWGIYSNPVGLYRRFGIAMTLLVLLICAVLLIWKFLVLRLTGF